MIVKDEATVIRRCLDSVRPLIDRWTIVDTGSTDGTQEIIREHMRDLPGTLIERPFVNFAHNRNEAIAQAREGADYLFVIDADEVVELVDGFVLPRLEADSYNAEVAYGGCTYLRKQFVRAALPWRYRGVVHEYLECREARTEAFLPGLWTIPHRDGVRARDPTTYRRDAILLERALIDEPDNSRYVFYLAQSYRDAGELELAIRNYERRAAMGGWVEEVWYSLYQVAVLKERLERPWPETMAAYLAAHQLRPDRAEPLFRVGAYYRGREEHHLAHLFLARAQEIPCPPSDRLFVERSLYDYEIAFEHAVASYHVGDHAGVIDANNRLLRSNMLPAELTEHVVRNRRHSVDALSPPGRRLPAPRLTVALVLDVGRPRARRLRRGAVAAGRRELRRRGPRLRNRRRARRSTAARRPALRAAAGGRRRPGRSAPRACGRARRRRGDPRAHADRYARRPERAAADSDRVRGRRVRAGLRPAPHIVGAAGRRGARAERRRLPGARSGARRPLADRLPGRPGAARRAGG